MSYEDDTHYIWRRALTRIARKWRVDSCPVGTGAVRNDVPDGSRSFSLFLNTGVGSSRKMCLSSTEWRWI
jgi:hypothetical protein